MMSLPDKDRYGQTKEWLIGRLGIAFGGRVAEELVFGPNKVTTGAGSDIEQATNIARRMVTQFGMSDKVGMMAVGEREQEVFLGREFGSRREISERTAQMVDDEVKHFLDEAHERARRILTEHRELLDRIANALLERETIDREDVDLLAAGKSLPPMTSSTPPSAPTALSSKPDAAAPQRAPILGAPPAEPMGA
jgi:cell division protease FtsH